uniref:Uncharacterized protein n=1 Tax=Geladintestivirus 4 TaxID=3233136 RepID=A0AAU8MK83_9CAUD
MNIDLIKYIMKLLVFPVLVLSLVLITHGDNDTISVINIIGFVLLAISGAYIINDAKNENE